MIVWYGRLYYAFHFCIFMRQEMYDELKQQINSLAPYALEAAGIITPARTKSGGYPTYICPVCGNGKGKSGDGIAVKAYSRGFGYKCFVCQKPFDNIELLRLHYNLGFMDTLKRAAAEFNLTNFQSYHNLKTQEYSNFAKNTSTDAAELDLIRKDIEQGKLHLKEMPEVDRRGLSLGTLEHFGCGYDAHWTHPKSRLSGRVPPPTPRLIIPAGNNHYNAVLPKRLRDDRNKSYWKMHAGKIQPFGVQTIDANTEVVIVFEGEIDAMTAWQSDFLKMSVDLLEAESIQALPDETDIPKMAYIATCGAANTNWIDAVARHCQSLGINPAFVINLDADKAGKLNAEKQVAEIVKHGFRAVANFLQEGTNG